MNIAMTNDALLAIYLNDHLAGSVSASELARRCLSNNRGTPLGVYLTTFIEEVEADRRALLDIMGRVGARPDPLKQAVGWAIEKVGRLKMNGSLFGYSDLSRLVEVEGLTLGAHGKLSSWTALIAVEDPRLDADELHRLERRARGQRDKLEKYRREAAVVAFGKAAAAA
jgi:hypothetical protein